LVELGLLIALLCCKIAKNNITKASFGVIETWHSVDAYINSMKTQIDFRFWLCWLKHI